MLWMRAFRGVLKVQASMRPREGKATPRSSTGGCLSLRDLPSILGEGLLGTFSSQYSRLGSPLAGLMN